MQRRCALAPPLEPPRAVAARPRRLRAMLLAGGAALALSVQAAAPSPAAGAPAGPVRSPHYGDALFLFYQGQHFSALSGLLASQQLRRTAPHDDEAELLRGGLLLGYGLHREAGAIFDRLAATGAAPSVRDRAWFFMARLRQQRGLLDDAQAALDRVGPALPGELEEDRQLLQGQLLLARGDAAAAAQALQAARERPSLAASRYLRFNLGVALLRAGRSAQGAALLRELGEAPAADEEARALRDKANLALGFTALREGAPREARAHLQRVRLQSLDAPAALLGFGWAADALDDPRSALVPWTELRSRGGSDAAVLEARLAVPHALASLGAFGQALQDYQQALQAYALEQTALDASIAAVQAGSLVDALLERTDGGAAPSSLITLTPAGPTVGTSLVRANEANARGLIPSALPQRLPDLPHPAQLVPLLAGHEFHQALTSLRDLRFLAANLDRWQQALGSYRDMLAHRKDVHEARLPALQAALARSVPTATGASFAPGTSSSTLEGLGRQRDALAAELLAAQEAADGRAFASEREAALRGLVQRSRATLERLRLENGGFSAPAGEALSAPPDAAQRLDRVEGALDWTLARALPERVWTARKALAATDASLTAAGSRAEAIRAAQRDEPARQDAFAARIEGLQARIAALQAPVAAAALEQQQAVQALAVSALEQQKARLQVYAEHARFALAQLHDRSLSASATASASPAAAPAAVPPANAVTRPTTQMPGPSDAAPR